MRESCPCLGSGIFTGDCGLVHVSSQATGTGQKKDWVWVFFVSHSFPEARGLGLEIVTVVWNRHMMIPLGPSLYIIYPVGRLQ